MSIFKTSLTWHKEKDFKYEVFNREHQILFSGNQILNSSSAPEYFGRTDFSNPEELFVGAISSCHMLTFLALASRLGYIIENYKDDAVATLGKNEEGRIAVTSVTLNPIVIFSGAEPEQNKLQDMHTKAHRNCFIAQSVKTKIEINF